jgi:hypothetical protein
VPGASACTMLQRAALRLSEGYGRNARDGTEHSLALCSTVTFEHSCAIMRACVRRKYRRMSLNSMHNTNVHYIEAVLLTHDRSRCPRNSLTELRGVCGVNPAVWFSCKLENPARFRFWKSIDDEFRFGVDEGVIIA